MKLRGLCVLALLALLFTVSMLPAAAHDEGECELSYLFEGWAGATAEGTPNGDVFGLLANVGAHGDTLLSASTLAAESVEFHETVMDGDVMQMLPIEGGLVIPANGYLQLQPGGLHMVLVNLAMPLSTSATLELTLNFEHAGEVVVHVPIYNMEDMAAHEGMAEGMAAEHDMGMEGHQHDMSAGRPSDVDWGEHCAGMHVLDAWARPAGPGMPNSAAYALLLNLTDSDDTLIAASADFAMAVELHEMTMGDGDVMQMRPIEGGIVVPAGGTAVLQPGGLHVMLIGLTAELEAGTEATLTLLFENAGEMVLTVPVRDPAEAPMAM